MSSQVNAQLRAAPIDPKTGDWTPAGLRLMNEILSRIGGQMAQTNIELAQDASDALTAANTAQTSANAAQATANTANSTANAANSTANALTLPQYVTLAASSTLTNERVATAGANIVMTDGGAGGALTFALAPDITGTATNMTIQPAAPIGSASAGSIVLLARNAVGGGGNVRLVSGNSSSGVGGSFNLYSGNGVTAGGAYQMIAGDASAAAGQGGSFSIQAGNCGAAGGLGGNITLTPGSGDATAGKVYVYNGYGSLVIEIGDDGSAPTLGIFGATAVVQPTNAITGAAFVANAGTAMNSASTAGGYTFGQVVASLKAVGILA